MALDFPVGTDFPTNGDQIPDGHEYEGFYWDSSNGVWKRLCERDKIGDCLDDDETVCDKLEALRQDVIELEEEIDAIAPSVEYGTWEWQNPNSDNVARPPEPGTFFLIDASNPLVPVLTNEYASTTRIAIHNEEYVAVGDLDPVDVHTWAEADIGKLIQLFDAADPDFLLGRITARDIQSDFVYLDIDRIQTSGQPNDNPDAATGDFLTRINIFNEPSGGTASEFVKIIGDTMTGNLAIDRSTGTANVAAALTLKGERPDLANSAATIKFENAKDSSNPGYLTYKSFGTNRWFAFDRDVDLNNNGLHSVAQIRMKPGGDIGSGTDKPRIVIRDGDTNNAGTQINRPGDSKRTFSIKGKEKGSSTVKDIFWCYGNNGTSGDAINYTGLVTNDNHIATKEYVDSKAGIAITCDSTNKNKGDMWYCSNDGVLYLRVS